MNEVLVCRDLRKTFREGKDAVRVLRGISLQVKEGEIVAIVGVSGSGKSTLLHLLGGLDAPTEGEVYVVGKNISVVSQADREIRRYGLSGFVGSYLDKVARRISEKKRELLVCQLRNEALGFVYQFHHLLMEFTALENVAMPLLIRRTEPDEARATAAAMLKEVGLAERLHHTPGELSGGERQRAALARALVTRPACVLADEPTGNLDRRTADNVFGLMLELNRVHGTSLVMATHEPSLAARAHRVMRLQDGVLVREG
jgi:lipoprotein-releasing system ATP-binding protein